MRPFRWILLFFIATLAIKGAGAQTQVLRWDSNSPAVAFRYPDLYGDDLRNMRFLAPAKCTLLGVYFAFPTRNFQQWTTGNPLLVTKVWPMGADSLPVPGGEWISDTTVFDSIRESIWSLDSAWNQTSARFVFVDLSAYHLHIPAPLWFHIGYTAVRDSEDDSLAILSDNGSLGSPYASEWYNGHFVPMSAAWGNVGLFIRAVVRLDSATVSVLEPGTMPANFHLRGAYPNPFNSSTRIAFDLARSGPATLTVFDILGRERAVLLNGPVTAGAHEIVLDAAGWASGMYFIKLSSGGGVQTVPLVLEK